MSRIPDSTNKNFLDSESEFPLHGAKNEIKYKSVVLSCSVLKSTVIYNWEF